MRSLVDRLAEAPGQLLVELARVLPGLRRDLGGEQVRDEPVLVGRPDRAVAPQERAAGALLAAEAEGAVGEPGHEPLEPHRHLDERSPEVLHDEVHHGARDDGLADPDLRAPGRTVPRQVRRAHCEVVVRIEETRAARHDAVSIGVGVVAERDVEAVPERDETPASRRATNSPCGSCRRDSHRHEAEGGGRPRRSRPRCRDRTPRRFDPRSRRWRRPSDRRRASACRISRRSIVDDVREVLHERVDEVVRLDAPGAERARERNPPDVLAAAGEESRWRASRSTT